MLSGVDIVYGFPVGLAIGENLIHVGQELLVVGVQFLVHLGLHNSMEVHCFGDLLKVVGDVVDNGMRAFLMYTVDVCLRDPGLYNALLKQGYVSWK
jgi:hypothetical protein